MKIGDSIIFVLLGIFLGIAAHSCVTTIFYSTTAAVEDTSTGISCDSTEEARLKMALRECSDAVMGYAWGDIDQ